jgi:hypothetical protein
MVLMVETPAAAACQSGATGGMDLCPIGNFQFVPYWSFLSCEESASFIV